MQPLSIILGKKSNNSSYEIQLEQLPHLLVSFYEKEQWHRFGNQFIQQLVTQISSVEVKLFHAVRFSTTVTDSAFVTPLYDATNDHLQMSKQLFVQQFIAAVDETAQKDLKQMSSASHRAPVRVVLIVDDLLDLLLSIRKSTAQKLIRLLYAGSGMGFCIIMASQHSRFHLVRQLQPWGKKNTKMIPPLRLAELVITADDLYFFKLADDISHERFYDLKEGEKSS